MVSKSCVLATLVGKRQLIRYLREFKKREKERKKATAKAAKVDWSLLHALEFALSEECCRTPRSQLSLRRRRSRTPVKQRKSSRQT